jgi:hypothetical protein
MRFMMAKPIDFFLQYLYNNDPNGQLALVPALCQPPGLVLSD